MPDCFFSSLEQWEWFTPRPKASGKGPEYLKYWENSAHFQEASRALVALSLVFLSHGFTGSWFSHWKQAYDSDCKYTSSWDHDWSCNKQPILCKFKIIALIPFLLLLLFSFSFYHCSCLHIVFRRSLWGIPGDSFTFPKGRQQENKICDSQLIFFFRCGRST